MMILKLSLGEKISFMNLFNKQAVAIDIDDRSIEIVEVKKQGNHAKLLNFSRQALPVGVVTNGLIKNPEQLRSVLIRALQSAKPAAIRPKKIALTLPAGQCYNLAVTAPFDAKDINEAIIKDLLTKNIPAPIEELLYSYRIVQSEPKKTLLFVAAIVKTVWREWLGFFASLNMEVDLLDSEVFALARDLTYRDPRQPVCLVDIGSIATNIFVLQSGVVYYENSLALGGHWFTRNIARQYKLTLVTAERKKLQLGLNRQIFPVLAKQLKDIAWEIKSAVNYYQENYGGAVKEVVLVGGSSRLRGLSDFLQETVGLPVSQGVLKSLPEKMPLEYYGAIGLAWRSVNRKKFVADPDFVKLAINDKMIKPAPTRASLSVMHRNIKQTTIKSQPPISARNRRVEKDMTSEDNLDPLESASEDLHDNTDNEVEKKLANQKKLLALIVLCGLVLLPLAFWYRQQERAKQAERMSRYASASYSQVQVLTFKVPAVLDVVDPKPGEIKARIIESTIASGQQYEVGLKEAMGLARGKLVKGEVLWPEPLNEVVRQDIVSAPLVLRWLAYAQTSVVKAGLFKIDALNKEKIDYSFSNLDILGIEKTDEVGSLDFKIQISITSGKPLMIKSEEEALSAQDSGARVDGATASAANSQTSVGSVSESTANVKKVIIKPTETGWLNIREGPGTNFGVVRQIDDSGSYEMLEEQGEWIKIKLPGNQAGWGSARYMQKL